MIEYQILNTGLFYADGGAMFGPVPKTQWLRKYPSNEQNQCQMAMQCLFVKDQERIILFDTGVGKKSLNSLEYYQFHELNDISGRLQQTGIMPEEVTDVVLSHLHFDHCGGCTYTEGSDLKITFPNAKHWVSHNQWKSYLHPNRMEKSAYRPEDMMPVYDAGLLYLIEENQQLTDSIELQLYDGHSKGQIASFIQTDGGLLVFSSDIIPTAAHRSTEWISAYDIEPLLSINAKLNLKKALKGTKAFFVFYHDAYKPLLQHF